MSKIKDELEKEKEFANKELEASEPKDYNYTDTDKAHLHTFRNKPLLGTSTVVGVLAKNLTWWASELSAVECLEAGELIPTIREEYLEAKKKGKPGIDALQKKYPIFKKARFAHFNDKNDKADKGTDMHEVMEEYVKRCIETNGGVSLPASIGDDVKLLNFIDWSLKEVDKFLFSEKHVYSERMWTGGILDLVFKLKNGKLCIGDFKSSKEAYISQFIQIAGYDVQQSENGIYTADGLKISNPLEIEVYCVFPFGADTFYPEIRYDIQELKKGFESCVQLYKLTN